MTPFVEALRSEEKPRLKDFPKVKPEDRHNIQTHVAYLDLLVRRGPGGSGLALLWDQQQVLAGLQMFLRVTDLQLLLHREKPRRTS